MSIKLVRWISIALLVIAIVFRFTNLSEKVYWHDEAFTSLQITAHGSSKFIADLFQQKLVTPAEVLQYQQIAPEKNFGDMLNNLSQEDPQHPPVYYGLAYFWIRGFGTLPATIRALSALLSVLVFPALYWLCLELFESSMTAWVSVALFAVSPFHLVYAQEAREYGFWTALILGSSALLLRAIRVHSWKNWLLYGCSVALIFYTTLFSFFVVLGHVLYVLIVDSGNRFFRSPPRLGKSTIWCIGVISIATLAFTPWIYKLITSGSLAGSTSWTAISLPFQINLSLGLFNFSRSFVDFNFQLFDPIAYLFILPILVLQLYALFYLYRTAPQRVSWFILTFIGSTALALGIPDLVGGGQRFTVPRYLIPCLVGLQLAVAYWISGLLGSAASQKAKLGRWIFGGLLALGLLSSGVYLQANTWWNKVLSSNYHQVAELVNGTDRPLLMMDAFGSNPFNAIALSYLLEPDTKLLLLPPVGDTFPVDRLPAEAQTVFLLNLPELFRQQFETTYHRRLTRVFQDPWNELWQIK